MAVIKRLRTSRCLVSASLPYQNMFRRCVRRYKLKSGYDANSRKNRAIRSTKAKTDSPLNMLRQF